MSLIYDIDSGCQEGSPRVPLEPSRTLCESPPVDPLSELDEALATVRALPRNLPAHVHAVTPPARVAPGAGNASRRGSVGAAPSTPRLPSPRPGPPPQFVSGGSAYPAHIQAALDEADPRARAQFERAARGSPTTPIGYSAGIEDLDLRPSYPHREVDPDAPMPVPLAGPPPPVATRRDTVRRLDAPIEAPLAPEAAGTLAALTLRAAELTGQLHATLLQMAALLQAQAPAQVEAPAPEVTTVSEETAAGPEPEPLPGPPPPAALGV